MKCPICKNQNKPYRLSCCACGSGLPVSPKAKSKVFRVRPVVARIQEPKEMHWKVGDGMDSPSGKFIIGQIAYIQKSDTTFEVRFYDAEGACRGGIPVQLIPPTTD